VQAEKHASGFSDGSDDADSALPQTDSAATSDLAFGRLAAFNFNVYQLPIPPPLRCPH